MNLLTFISLWILLLCLISQIYSLGIGKVFIGFMPNSSLIQSTSTSQKSNISSPSFNLPVYVTVSDVNGSQPLAVNVSIECETSRNQTGYTIVSFSPLTLFEGNPEGIIIISLIEAGRPVEVRCFGNNILLSSNSSECSNFTQIFTKATSISEPWPLIVLPKLTVSICDSPIAVPEASGRFRVEFSEPVKDSLVVVSCNPVDPAVMELVIFDTKASINSTFAWMKYHLVNGSLTSPVTVSCIVKNLGGNASAHSLPGNPGLFVPNVVNVSLIASSLQVKSIAFEAFLIPRGLSGQDIHMQCFSDTVQNQQAATAFFDSINCLKKNTTTNLGNQTTPANFSSTTQTTPTSSLPTTRTTTLANFSSTTQTTTPAISQPKLWLINNPNLTVTAEGASIQLRRQFDVIEPTLELVALTCCASLTPGIQVLHKRKLTLSVIVSLEPFIYYNDSQLISIDEIRPTLIDNPAKKNFASCPCDMTWNSCDINCCCDMDCSPSDVDIFSKCIPGYQGAQQLPPPPWMCDSTSPQQIPFMCVRTKDSAYLGLFRHDKSTISNSITFKTELTPKRYSFSKADSSDPGKTENFNYKYGSHIQSSIPNIISPVPRILTLPQRTFSGQCATTAPVPFLINIKSDCIYQMTPDLCSDNSILSATSFALSTALRNPHCPPAYTILNGLEQQFVKTEVFYHCTSNSKTYLKSLDTLSDVLSQSLESSQNFTIPDVCIIDSSGLYHCPNNVEESLSAMDEDLPPLCPWDDGYTRPSTPTLRNGSQCDNVVLSVRYNFTWSGSKIEFLNVSVILGNINLFNLKQQKTLVYTSESVKDPFTNVTRIAIRTSVRTTTVNKSSQLNPRYEVMYTHNFNNSKGDGSDGLQKKISGNPGYIIGEPIWSGTAVTNETTEKQLYVNQHESQQMNVWEPSPSGLCSLADKKKIIFGEDLFSSCVIFLTQDSLNDCQNLRKWLFYQLSLLMPSDRIGRYGNNGAKRSSDWIKVLRENISDQFPDIVPVPEFNSTNMTMENNSSTIGVSLPWTTESTVANNKSNFSQGTCIQMPTGVVLDIMYANTGLVQGTRINEIIGARASYVFDNWTFTCIENVMVGSCMSPSWNINSTERYQLFTLTSVVHFIRVPERRPKSVIRYDELPLANRHTFEFDFDFGDIFYLIFRQPEEDFELYMNKIGVILVLIFTALLSGFIILIL